MEANLEPVPFIHYLVQFRKDQNDIKALIGSGSKVNKMRPAYAAKLSLSVRKTEAGAQNIDKLPLETFGMVIAGSQTQDKLKKVQFFQETFLSANTSMEVVPGMPFLTPKSTALRFGEKELVWSTYTAAETLPATRIVEIIDKKFAAAALNRHDEGFVVHISAILGASTKMTIHPS